MKKIAIIFTFCMLIVCNSTSIQAWISTDPNDVQQLVHTSWEFNYTDSNNKDHTKKIEFGDIIKTNAYGHKALECTDGESYGLLFHANYPTKEKIGFICILFSSIDWEYYMFNFENEIAIGNFSTYNSLYLDNPIVFDLIGSQIEESISPLLSSDNNNSGCFIIALLLFPK